MSARAVFQLRCQLFRLMSSCNSNAGVPRCSSFSPLRSNGVPCAFTIVRHQSQAQLKPVDPDAKLKQEEKPKPAPVAKIAAEEPLAAPQAPGTERDYAPKIRKIVDDIAALSILEVADLNELLKKTLKIPDQAFMSAGGFAPAQAAAPAAEEEEAVKKKEKSSFTIRLLKFDEGKKVQLIKEIKGLIEGMNLVQAKKYVESLPQTVRQDIAKDEAEKLKAALEAVGGVVEMD
ncbi:39S ribosomal protein L12, mitochondrial-like [Paramacrobiotus metropolitanus]|uniref:39S ribosomal protein L12, mitochondrial-like n=1 Tax=Paramacrobiotus metropolitanus TaxID=2943436 RepID=UPI002445B666|nr:39S ribosomal protein L12, mitochondrial-like [Paramacrobiotus metropolitanus]